MRLHDRGVVAPKPPLESDDTPLVGTLPGFSPWRATLFVFTYASFIIAVNTIYALMPALKVALDFTSGDAAVIGSVQTGGLALGMLFWGGWPADAIGSRRSYAACMLYIAACTVVVPRLTGAAGLGALAFTLEFFATPIYPCHVNFVRGWMPPAQWSHGFWLLGMASRSGDVVAKLGFGGLLAYVSWQSAALLSAAYAVVAAAIGAGCHRDTPTARDHASVRMTASELRAVLRRVFGSGRFYGAALAMSTTNILKRTLEALGALYFFEVCDVTEGEAAQLASSWPAGILFSVIAGGYVFNRLETARAKTTLVGGLMCLSILGCALLTLLSSPGYASPSATSVRAAAVFVTACGIGLPFYVPTGMFAVSFGGRSSGVVHSYMDFVAFGTAAVWLALLRPLLDSPGGWAKMWACLGLAAVAMLVANVLFLRSLFAELEAKVTA